MVNYSELEDLMKRVFEANPGPIFLYSAIWPLARATGIRPNALCEKLCDFILEYKRERMLGMPVFCNGFSNGICDLDNEPSQTGILTESYRCVQGVKRTVSAFFSFAVHGKGTEELLSLRPAEAWGEGSLYEWLYEQGGAIVTLGVHPTQCSYSHYCEWLGREKITYRSNKNFRGRVIHQGKMSELSETLFVRSLEPPVINDFTWLLDIFLGNGMKLYKKDGIQASSINARDKIDLMMKELEKDPLCLVKRS